MDLEAALETIDGLPVEERIVVVQRILDGIAEDHSPTRVPPLSPAFRAELDRRIAAGDAHPERGIPWEVVEAESEARERE